MRDLRRRLSPHPRRRSLHVIKVGGDTLEIKCRYRTASLARLTPFFFKLYRCIEPCIQHSIDNDNSADSFDFLDQLSNVFSIDYFIFHTVCKKLIPMMSVPICLTHSKPFGYAFSLNYLAIYHFLHDETTD